MKLFEHPDFEQAILQAAEHFREQRLRPAIIEKDYYVTEALRNIGATFSDRVIFKGAPPFERLGLIARFSEDIDIFLDPLAYAPALGSNAADRELKRLRDVVATHPGLKFCRRARAKLSVALVATIDSPISSTLAVLGKSRTVWSPKPARQAGANRPPLVELSSYVGQFLRQRGLSMGADDESAFSMRLLHFRRTFVEKMFAIHGKVELLTQGKALGSYARHYYVSFHSPRSRRCWRCSNRSNTKRSRKTMIA